MAVPQTTLSAITTQTAMTLSAIASTAATPRPSGETLRAQTDRVARGIRLQLSNSSLTQAWELRWLALSPDNANMAYIARNKVVGANQVAVVIRGTDATVTDLLEDFDVGSVVPFTASGSSSPISVSKGAMEAFTQVVTMQQDSVDPITPGNLVQALAAVLQPLPPQSTVFVIGHSLGGCIATMTALYVKALTWAKQPNFGVLTYAAPTAGLGSFAAYFDSQTWSQNERCVNDYDLVPRAWADLQTPLKDDWYPHPPGPQATFDVQALIKALEAVPGNNTYVQPGGVEHVRHLNSNYGLRDDSLVAHSTEDFLGQVGFQHANSTYMALLQAPLTLQKAPRVDLVTPGSGTAGSKITIIGDDFTPDSLVDFGLIPCPAGTYRVTNRSQITVDHVPAGVGIVDVRVTNPLGTSPASPTGQFAYGGPEPVAVTSINPTEGRLNDPITVSGLGFAAGVKVYFGANQSQSVKFDPLERKITATAPASGKAESTTVNVTVVVNGYSSPTSPVNEFTYRS